VEVFYCLLTFGVYNNAKQFTGQYTAIGLMLTKAYKTTFVTQTKQSFVLTVQGQQNGLWFAY